MKVDAHTPKLMVFIALLLLSQTGLAQLGRGLQPTWAHLDKAFYLAGDPLGFQLYLAPEFAEEDILFQSILFSANGEPVFYNYWRQDDNHLHGQFQLPESLPTGWYYLSFRAWDDNRKTERVVHQVPLAIYNGQTTITPAEVSQREPARETAKVQVPEKELQIEVAELPTSIKPGEAINLNFKVTNRRGRPVEASCSVSITDWELLSAARAMGMDNLQTSDSLLVITPAHLDGRFYWQGSLLDEEGNPLTETSFTINNAADRQQMATDARGRFVFLSQQRSVRELAVTLANDQAALFRFQPARGRLALGRLFYSPAAFRYLEVSRQRQAIRETLAQTTPAKVGAVNLVADLEGRFPVVAAPNNQIAGWQSGSSSAPASRVSQWFSNLQTGASGGQSVTFEHAWEVRAYRIDIVAQDDEGRRGRTTMVYRVPIER